MLFKEMPQAKVTSNHRLGMEEKKDVQNKHRNSISSSFDLP